MWWPKGNKEVTFVNKTNEPLRLRERFRMALGAEICACLPPSESCSIPAYDRSFFRLKTFYEIELSRPRQHPPGQGQGQGVRVAEGEDGQGQGVDEEEEEDCRSPEKTLHRTALNPSHRGTVYKGLLSSCTVYLKMGADGFIYGDDKEC